MADRRILQQEQRGPGTHVGLQAPQISARKTSAVRPRPLRIRTIISMCTKVKTHVVKKPPQFHLGSTNEVTPRPMARQLSGTVKVRMSIIVESK